MAPLPDGNSVARTREVATISATPAAELDLIAPGSRVIVRDQTWLVTAIERLAMDTRAIVRCVGQSELVRDQEAAFFSDLDRIEPEDPARTKFRLDTSPHGIETRLLLDSMIRRTPVPVSNTGLTVGHQILADDLPYQREPFRKAMGQLQPRLLVADAVGLGKTIEVGMLLAELQRRGRANRVLAVVPRHILDQLQHELWCRCAFPLVRLDSDGIQKVRQRIPAGQNPFTYFNRVIVSIDTIKNPSRYRHHLEKVRWDVVWIDEAHSVANRSAQRARLAQVLAPNADALILTTATPHNGNAETFADLISLLDPTAVPDPTEVTADDIKHLVVRRHKHSPDVEAVVGDRWAERAEPVPIAITPTYKEEAVFSELSRTWLDADAPRPSKDRLFAFTLLKAALSSPVALLETVENRLKRREAEAGTGDSEVDALRRLHGLADEALQDRSGKLDVLVETLEKIGVGKGSDVRAVIFSERIRTLDWIAEELCDRLGMGPDQVETFHNSKSDEEQQRIVEAFSMASEPIRVLVTSDIASEGVNLHKQCHHLIHFDVPWSLITLEQRNGRIDRYGQRTPPEIRYLLYNPSDPEVAGDVRVIAKLIEKENTAHKALGDAASVMGLYSETAEEAEIIKVLSQQTSEDREEALEAVAPADRAFDPWAFAGLTGDENEGTHEAAPVSEVPNLFESVDEYLTAGLQMAYQNLSQLRWETDGPVVSFEPPDDLLRRLDVLPQSYLRQRDLLTRLRLTTDRTVAQRSLDDAVNQKATSGEGGTAWPEIHYLGPQHPVIDWLADKLLYRLGRNEAIALACDVPDPTVLVSASWSNTLGEPIASAWLAATLEDGIVVFDDMFEVLEKAGVGPEMVNASWEGSLADLEAMLPAVQNAAHSYLEGELEGPLADVEEKLRQTRRRLERWQDEARKKAEQRADSRRRLERIDHITRQIDGLIADHSRSDAPLIRIVGALLPRR